MLDSKLLKHIARQFLILTATGSVDEAFASFVDDSFIHHNQYFKGDRETLKRAMQDSAASGAPKLIEVKSLLQEGDHITAYSHVHSADYALNLAVFHMFRFNNGKIVELWDVGQHIAKDCPNEHGLF
jgi:predicted SnoaL-like aldol condensation-catalyzing enzyme